MRQMTPWAECGPENRVARKRHAPPRRGDRPDIDPVFRALRAAPISPSRAAAHPPRGPGIALRRPLPMKDAP